MSSIPSQPSRYRYGIRHRYFRRNRGSNSPVRPPPSLLDNPSPNDDNNSDTTSTDTISDDSSAEILSTADNNAIDVQMFIYKNILCQNGRLTIDYSKQLYEIKFSDCSDNSSTTNGISTWHTIEIPWKSIVGMARKPVKNDIMHLTIDAVNSGETTPAETTELVAGVELSVSPPQSSIQSQRYNLRNTPARVRRNAQNSLNSPPQLSNNGVDTLPMTIQSGELQLPISLSYPPPPLREKLILELSESPVQYTTRGRHVIDTKYLRSKYIGLQYTINHCYHILGCDKGLLGSDATKYALLNQGLPSWIWVPFLNHFLRVLVEKVILIVNICLFFWTLYQILKYTNSLQSIYQIIIKPLFRNTFEIITPFMDNFYFIANFLSFDIIVWQTFLSKIYTIVYDCLSPINTIYLTSMQYCEPLFTVVYSVARFWFSGISMIVTTLFWYPLYVCYRVVYTFVVCCNHWFKFGPFLAYLYSIATALPCFKLCFHCLTLFSQFWSNQYNRLSQIVAYLKHITSLSSSAVTAAKNVTPSTTNLKRAARQMDRGRSMATNVGWDWFGSLIVSLRMSCNGIYKNIHVLVDVLARPLNLLYKLIYYIQGVVGQYFKEKWRRRRRNSSAILTPPMTMSPPIRPHID